MTYNTFQVSLAALLPIVIYLGVLQIFDAFSMTRWYRLAGHTVWGATCAVIMYALVAGWRFLHDGQSWEGLLPSVLIEETLKAVLLLGYVAHRRIAFLAESQIYGCAVGAGFAFVENVMYLSYVPDMEMGSALIRGMGTSLLHMGTTSMLVSLWLLLPWSGDIRRINNRYNYVFGLLLFIPSVTIHYIYNMWLLPPAAQLLCVLITFFLIFIIVSTINERQTLRWLDISLQSDVILLQALHEGRLCETPAGKYLASIRKRFKPLVFFDMCVYVQLYLDLLMAGKSRIMLRDAGLEVKMSEEEQKVHNSKMAELKAISARIPIMGHYLLRPILHTSVQNKWAMEH